MELGSDVNRKQMFIRSLVEVVNQANNTQSQHNKIRLIKRIFNLLNKNDIWLHDDFFLRLRVVVCSKIEEFLQEPDMSNLPNLRNKLLKTKEKILH